MWSQLFDTKVPWFVGLLELPAATPRLPAREDDAARRTLLRRWESSAVMRSIHAELLVRGSAWEATFAGGFECVGFVFDAESTAPRATPNIFLLQTRYHSLNMFEVLVAEGEVVPRVEKCLEIYFAG